MKIFNFLFKHGFLPGRFSAVLDHRYEVRRSGFLNLFSHFDHIHPKFVTYLEEQGVVYRLGRRRASNGRIDPCVFFWSKRDWEIFCDANDPERITVSNKMTEWFIEEMKDLDVACIQEETQYGYSYFTVFSTKRMVELMLRYDIVGDGYKTRKLIT